MATLRPSDYTAPRPVRTVGAAPVFVDIAYAALVAFPVAGFTLALLTDIAYWRSANLMWQYFSEWLLLAGLVGGALAALVWLVGLLVRHDLRTDWLRALLNLAVLALALLNSLIHAGDGWTGVVPWGLALSALTVILMIASAVLALRFITPTVETYR